MNKFKNINKSLLQYTFLILLMAITTYLVFKSLDISMLSSVVKMVDSKFILLGALSISLYVYLEGLVLKIMIDDTQKVKVRFIGFKLAIMGFYYNLVTPFASGSQPMQIYILNKCKVPLSKSSAIVTNKSLIYQTMVTIYCSSLILINSASLKGKMPGMMLLVYMGIAINAFTIIMAVLVVLNPNKVKIIARFIIGFISRYKTFEFLVKKLDNVESFIDEYSQSVRSIIKNKRVLFLTIVLTVIQLTCYFSISFWIYKAFNLDGHSYIYLLTLQAFLYMAISPIPTPGNIGANEIAFFTIFNTVFPKPLMGYAVFLYGGFMYYLILIGSGVFTVITHYRMKKKNYTQIASELV
ncbi:UPF0104 family protein [Romboutsia weinsteinii]|uniref:Phosphatidylglycerol lysyltransferase n=1 Tax=Romboutsia weinsteinii TaxID=2020949 RepID=A0A371J1R6_9FIRM|nr:lysylphosphatidylglycerol synthase transmembrane domain-containing protein [Romboutsia weinsteinii]RDY26623.1 UPF0104 family protein [Romboutsia weinsteinii]